MTRRAAAVQYAGRLAGTRLRLAAAGRAGCAGDADARARARTQIKMSRSQCQNFVLYIVSAAVRRLRLYDVLRVYVTHYYLYCDTHYGAVPSVAGGLRGAISVPRAVTPDLRAAGGSSLATEKRCRSEAVAIRR